MIVVTTNDLPGYRVDAVIGEVFGLTVRARNIGAQFGAGFKAMFGGELKGLTQQLQQTRDEAMTRMVAAAQYRGANAILAMRYDSNEIADGWQELVAYGTAVVVTPVTPNAQAQFASIAGQQPQYNQQDQTWAQQQASAQQGQSAVGQ